MTLNRRGMVLIFTMWVLAFLTVLAVSVAAGIRQKIILVKRLDERSRTHYLKEAAVQKACAFIRKQLDISGFLYTPVLKQALHNNNKELNRIELAEDEAEVGYTFLDHGLASSRFGVVDEERKINLNYASKQVLITLFMRVLNEKEDQATKLAEAILDWRQYGSHEAQGFFSDEYYSNLQYPYRKKDADYETLDELLLIKGMTKERFEKLLDYVTIYGDGKININTAGPEVLMALGLDEPTVEKILLARRGKDTQEDTWDDYIFYKTFDIATEVKGFVKLTMDEVKAIDQLNAQNLLTVTSSFFTIKATTHLVHKTNSQHVYAVFTAKTNQIVYWKEK